MNVTIHGNGAVLDAAQQGQFFNVNSGATLALDHLTLRNGFVRGNEGGAIYNLGDLTVKNANFISNKADISSGGVIYISSVGTCNIVCTNFTRNSAQRAEQSTTMGL